MAPRTSYRIGRRRRRHRRRRFRFHRRYRKYHIRRPTAGTYYTKKFSTMNLYSPGKPEASKPWRLGHYTTSLSEWTSSTNFDYYKILKMKIAFYPQESPASQHTLTWGHTIIDLDGGWATEGWTSTDPYCNSSTRKIYMSNKKHSRYFTPKPMLQGTSSTHPGQSLFFNQKTPWLNTYDTSTKWGALLFSMYVPSQDATAFYVEKSVWIRFKAVL